MRERPPASKKFVRRLAKERKQIVKEVTDATEKGMFEEYRGEEMGVSPDL